MLSDDFVSRDIIPQEVAVRYLMILILMLACVVSGCGQTDAVSPPAAKATPVLSVDKVKPVKTKPDPVKEEPDPQPEPAEPKPPQDEAEYVSFGGGLVVWPEAGRAELKVMLLGSQSRALEFFLVGPGGANHESLFQTGCNAEDLKRALEILELKEAERKFLGRGHSGKPTGDRVRVSVRFEHSKTGKEVTVPVEDWLIDMRTGKAPESAGFVFTGSHEKYDADINRSIVEADLKGNFIALWRDGSCLLDNDRDGGGIPDIYSPNPDADGIPNATRGKQPLVTLIFERWKES